MQLYISCIILRGSELHLMSILGLDNGSSRLKYLSSQTEQQSYTNNKPKNKKYMLVFGARLVYGIV